MTTLTPRQRELFDFVHAYTCEHGYQPTFRELMDAMGMKSPNGVKCHLDALTKKGWLALSGTQSRAMKFLRNPDGSPFRGFLPV